LFLKTKRKGKVNGVAVWDVQWDKLRDDNVKYPPPRTNIPPPSRKREGKSKAGEDQSV